MSIYGIHGRVPHIPLKKSMCWNTRVIWTQYLNAYGKEDMGNTLTLGRQVKVKTTTACRFSGFLLKFITVYDDYSSIIPIVTSKLGWDPCTQKPTTSTTQYQGSQYYQRLILFFFLFFIFLLCMPSAHHATRSLSRIQLYCRRCLTTWATSELAYASSSPCRCCIFLCFLFLFPFLLYPFFYTLSLSHIYLYIQPNIKLDAVIFKIGFVVEDKQGLWYLLIYKKNQVGWILPIV